MFPDNFIENTNTENTTEEVGIDFLFDYKTDPHIMKNSVIVECNLLQGVKQFIQNVHKVYTEGETDAFGISIYDYLGHRTLPMGYINSELKSEVTE